MRMIFIVLVLALGAFAPILTADSGPLNGTWSGNWTPKSGVPDAITIEIRQDTAGTLTGKFVNPTPMEFSKTTFNAKTGLFSAEATDQKSGKRYKLDGKVEGTELKGTLSAGEATGDLRLIKWTFFGR
jgi:hypothetical protein